MAPVEWKHPDPPGEGPVAPAIPSTEWAEPEALEVTAGSFWVLAKLEAGEALLLLLLNALFLAVAVLSSGVPLTRLYREMWYALILVHLTLSWTLMMVPIVLAGQSPLMGRLGLLVDADLPERRLAYSIMHLVSVCLFPISFLCMVLTPEHRTLAELSTGQEILVRT